MATRGLSFENPLYQDSGGVPSAVVNPFGFGNAAASSGSDALRDDMSSLAMMGRLGVQMARQNQFTMPEMKQPPSIGYSPSRKEFFVQGTTFAADDAQGLLQAEGLLGGPSTGLPTGGDWVPLDTQSYGQLVQNVRNPSLGTLAARNFGRGVDVTQMLAGRALQLAGAEETGGRIVGQQMEDLRKTTPYERQFTDIESGRGAVEWLVANFAQQGPNMIESIATAGLGFLAGTAASGTPVGGAAAAFSSLLGKAAWKEGVKSALSKQAKGEALNVAEQKLLREAAGIAGAVAASYGQNLATGAADIYGELREQGAGAEDTNARLTALAGSVPYAVLETLPEFLLAGRVFKGVGAPTPMGVGVSPTRRGLELLKRGATGFAIGGTAEGATELGQEALLLGLSDQDFGSPENVNRLINSFAAGFGVGGPFGAVANLRGKQPANLLNPAQSPDPAPSGGPLALIPPTLPANAPRGTQGELFPVSEVGPQGAVLAPSIQRGMQGELFPGAAMQQPPILGVVQPTQPMASGVQGELFPMEPAQRDMFEQLATSDRIRAGIAPSIPATIPGQQGLLNLFGDTGISPQELATRMQPQAPLPGLPAPIAAPVVNPAQGALQFAGAAPTAPANTQMQNQLQAIQDRIRRQREFEAAQAQQAALIQQQTEELARQSRNARDLYAMQQAQQQAGMQQPMPMRPAGPTQPQQLPLFTRRQAPVPPKAGQLRRGGRMQAAAPVEAQPAARGAQVPLFTQEGQPSMAALKSAGVKTKITPAPAKPPVVKPRTQRGLKKQAGVAAVEVKETPSATQKGKLKQGRVAERQQDNAGVQGGGNAGNQPATQVKAGGAQAGGGGKPVVSRPVKTETLKKGEPTGPKVEAAPAALAAPVVEGPIALNLELSDGSKLKVKDGQKLLTKLDQDIKKFEDLLACLVAAR